MKYCSKCGSDQLSFTIPTGDSRFRHVCGQCNTIHYQNPNIICGTISTWQGKVLLCKRAINPRSGYWTLPAGFMENGESTEEGAARETAEEACAQVRIEKLFSVISVPYMNQVHLFYRGELVDGLFGTGEESLETQLFDFADIPWQDIAFRTVTLSLRLFETDLKNKQFQIHNETLMAPNLKERTAN